MTKHTTAEWIRKVLNESGVKWNIRNKGGEWSAIFTKDGATLLSLYPGISLEDKVAKFRKTPIPEDIKEGLLQSYILRFALPELFRIGFINPYKPTSSDGNP